MKRLIVLLAVIGVALPAAANEAIIKKARCVACHSVEQKRVGPAYKDVANRYRGQDVAETLFQKVRHGGKGNWGEIPMTPHSPEQISDDDLKTAIAWILNLQ